MSYRLDFTEFQRVCKGEGTADLEAHVHDPLIIDPVLRLEEESKFIGIEMLVENFIFYLNVIGIAPGDEADLMLSDPEKERSEYIFYGRSFFNIALADPC